MATDNVLEWLKKATELLQDSKWCSSLFTDDLNVIDILHTYLYYSLRNSEKNIDIAEGQKVDTDFQKVLQQLDSLKNIASSTLTKIKFSLASSKPEQTSVVFWPWQKSHVKILHPVANLLSEQGVDNRFIVTNQTIFNSINKRKIPAVYPSAHWPVHIYRAKKQGQLHAQSLAVAPEVELPSLFDTCSSQELCTVLRKTIVPLLPLVFQLITTAKIVIETMHPKVLVVGNDLTIAGRIGCLIAKQNGIKSACFMHGNSAGDPLQGGHIADNFLVYGDVSAHQVEKMGFPSSKISICGAPYLDNLPSQTGSLNSTIRNKLGIGNKKMVLIATSGPGRKLSFAHHQMIIKELMQVSIKYPEICFVAKLHPKDKAEYYDRARETFPNAKLKVISSGANGYPVDIFQWLQGCSLVLSGTSMVAVEAMLMDVPVVTMDFVGEVNNIPYIDAGATLHVTSTKNLEKVISDLIKSPDALSDIKKRAAVYLKKNFFALDGKSSHRASSIIKNMM